MAAWQLFDLPGVELKYNCNVAQVGGFAVLISLLALTVLSLFRDVLQ